MNKKTIYDYTDAYILETGFHNQPDKILKCFIEDFSFTGYKIYLVRTSPDYTDCLEMDIRYIEKSFIFKMFNDDYPEWIMKCITYSELPTNEKIKKIISNIDTTNTMKLDHYIDIRDLMNYFIVHEIELGWDHCKKCKNYSEGKCRIRVEEYNTMDWWNTCHNFELNSNIDS